MAKSIPEEKPVEFVAAFREAPEFRAVRFDESKADTFRNFGIWPTRRSNHMGLGFYIYVDRDDHNTERLEVHDGDWVLKNNRDEAWVYSDKVFHENFKLVREVEKLDK